LITIYTVLKLKRFDVTQSITNFKNNMIHSLTEAAGVLKAAGRQIVTFDRSDEVWGETPEAQLKGRARMITTNLAIAAFGALALAVFAFGCSAPHPGAFNYFMVGGAGCFTLAALKEVVMQNIARQREKKKYGIEKETEKTRYSFQELMDDYREGAHKTFNRLFGSNSRVPSTDNDPIEKKDT